MTPRERHEFIKASGRIAGSSERMNGRDVDEAFNNFRRFPALANLKLGTLETDRRSFAIGYSEGRDELIRLEMYKTNARLERDRILKEANFQSGG